MGVKRKIKKGVSKTTKVLCVSASCPSGIVPLEFVDQKVGTVQYAGACSLCGREYTLLTMKESK